jgi:[ribosomal protein S5]-alanine N-acetyltransferase
VNTWPDIQTERLLLRRVDSSDIETMSGWLADDSQSRHALFGLLPQWEVTRNLERTLASVYHDGSLLPLAIELKALETPLGFCGLSDIMPWHGSARLTVAIEPSFRRRGYAAEATSELISFATSVLHLHRLEGRCVAGDHAAIRLFDILGMRFEGELRDAEFRPGGRVSSMVYSRTGPAHSGR